LELLVLLLVLLCAGGDLNILFGEHAHNACCHFVVDDGLVVLADDIYAELLQKDIRGLETVIKNICSRYIRQCRRS
jgi:hypothetical protein